MVIKTPQNTDKLEAIYENLFNPINEKRRTYWDKPVNTAKKLVEYATEHNNTDKYLEIYTSINDDEIGTIKTIFLDFDIDKDSLLEWELNNTLNNTSSNEVYSIVEKYKKTKNITDLTDEERTKLLNYLNTEEQKKLLSLKDRELP